MFPHTFQLISAVVVLFNVAGNAAFPTAVLPRDLGHRDHIYARAVLDKLPPDDGSRPSTPDGSREDEAVPNRVPPPTWGSMYNNNFAGEASVMHVPIGGGSDTSGNWGNVHNNNFAGRARVMHVPIAGGASHLHFGDNDMSVTFGSDDPDHGPHPGPSSNSAHGSNFYQPRPSSSTHQVFRGGFSVFNGQYVPNGVNGVNIVNGQFVPNDGETQRTQSQESSGTPSPVSDAAGSSGGQQSRRGPATANSPFPPRTNSWGSVRTNSWGSVRTNSPGSATANSWGSVRTNSPFPPRTNSPGPATANSPGSARTNSGAARGSPGTRNNSTSNRYPTWRP